MRRAASAPSSRACSTASSRRRFPRGRARPRAASKSIYVSKPSATDPHVAPAGHENLFVLVPVMTEYVTPWLNDTLGTAPLIGPLLGAGITSDGYHMVSPDVEGGGAARAMKRAMETAGLSRSDIDFINAHATATPIGDTAEAKAINAVVGTDAAIYAPKGALGHSIGAVGALEAALTVLSIRDGIIPPTLNLENQDPEIELDVVHGAARTGDISYALNNSFGFGGHNVALAFGKY